MAERLSTPLFSTLVAFQVLSSCKLAEVTNESPVHNIDEQPDPVVSPLGCKAAEGARYFFSAASKARAS